MPCSCLGPATRAGWSCTRGEGAAVSGPNDISLPSVQGNPSAPEPAEGAGPAGAAAGGPSVAPEDIAGPEELAEVLDLARESGDGSLLMRTLARAALWVPLPPALGGGAPGRRHARPCVGRGRPSWAGRSRVAGRSSPARSSRCR